MKEVSGAIVGAVYEFLLTAWLCLLLHSDFMIGLLFWMTSPVIGAVVGGMWFHRIRWERRSVALTARCAVAAALLGGVVNVIFQVCYAGLAPLSDFTNSLAPFLYGTMAGKSFGICVGRVSYRRVDTNLPPKTLPIAYGPYGETWPPPPADRPM